MTDYPEFEYDRVWTNPEDFPELEYTKTWESQDDFPTMEGCETEVRAVMQALFTAGGLDGPVIKEEPHA